MGPDRKEATIRLENGSQAAHMYSLPSRVGCSVMSIQSQTLQCVGIEPVTHPAFCVDNRAQVVCNSRSKTLVLTPHFFPTKCSTTGFRTRACPRRKPGIASPVVLASSAKKRYANSASSLCASEQGSSPRYTQDGSRLRNRVCATHRL